MIFIQKKNWVKVWVGTICYGMCLKTLKYTTCLNFYGFYVFLCVFMWFYGYFGFTRFTIGHEASE